MNDNLFQCGLCGDLTPFVQKTDKLENAVHHTYAECMSCKGKTTICYTNKHIRALLLRQENMKASKKMSNKKLELADKIQAEMRALQKEYEGVFN